MKLKEEEELVVSGSVKVASGSTGFGTGHVKDKTGSVSLHQDDSGVWRGVINYEVQRGSGLRFTIAPGKQNLQVKHTTLNQSGVIMIQFTDGSYIRIANVSSNRENSVKLKKVLDAIQNGTFPANRPYKAVTQQRVPSSTVDKPQVESNVRVSPSANGKIFDPSAKTSVYFDKTTSTPKRNEAPNKPSTSGNFLTNGINKAQATTSSFYGNSSSSTPTRNYGSFANKENNGVTPTRKPLIPSDGVARRPGLLDSNKQSRWGEKAERNKQLQLQGFSNLGNTCYMNAILQSLFALSTFSADLSTLCRDLNLGAGIDDESLYWNLGLLLKLQKEKGVIDASSQDQQRLCLNKIKGAISNTAKRFSGHQQHDAHEFLGQVLDQLKEEVDKLNKKITDITGSESKGTAELLHPNPSTKNFEFEVLHTITCTQCGNKVEKTEICNDLSITLPRRRDKAKISLQDMLDVYFKSEDIEYSCEECKAESATVRHVFSKLPRILILHLKRYSFHRSSTTNTKTGQEVDIHRFLTLRSQCTTGTSVPSPASPRTFSQIQRLKDMERKVKEEQKHADFTTYRDQNGDTEKNESIPRTPLGQRNQPNTTSQSSANKFRFRSTKPSAAGSSSENGAKETDNTWLNSSGPKNTDEISDEDIVKCLEESTETAEVEERQRKEIDEHMKEALERSTIETEELPDIPGVVPVADLSSFSLQHMTEDEQFQLAIQESLRDGSGMTSEAQKPAIFSSNIDSQAAEEMYSKGSQSGDIDYRGNGTSIHTNGNPETKESVERENDVDTQMDLFPDEDDEDLYGSQGDSNRREGMLQYVDGTWDDDGTPSNQMETDESCVGNHSNQNDCDSMDQSPERSDVIGHKVSDEPSGLIGNKTTNDFDVVLSLDGTCDLPSDGEPESPIPAECRRSRRSTSTPLGQKRSLSDNSPNKLSRSGKKSRRTLYKESVGSIYSPQKNRSEKPTTPVKIVTYNNVKKENGPVDDIENIDNSNGALDENGLDASVIDSENSAQDSQHQTAHFNENGLDSQMNSQTDSSMDANDIIQFKRDTSEQYYTKNNEKPPRRSTSDPNLFDRVTNESIEDYDSDMGANIGADIKREEHLNDPQANSGDVKKMVYDLLKDNVNIKPFLGGDPDGGNEEYVADNKENRTPPRDDSALNLSNSRRSEEDENEQVQRALDASLQEQQHRNRTDDVIPNGMSEEDAIKAAINASLQEVSTNIALTESDVEEMYDSEDSYKVKRSEHDEKQLQKNVQTGILDHSYRVISVVSHLGMSSKYGHYVSDAYDFLSRNWLSYDDTKVCPTKERDVMLNRAGTGYIFFYASKELIEQLETQLETKDS